MPDDEDVKDSDGDDPISISLETPGGRTQLNGEPSGEGPASSHVEVEVGPATPIEVEVVAEGDREVPGGLDLDTYVIDQEIAPLVEEGERYPGWRVGLSRKVGAYIELIRPFTLLAPLFGGLGASFLALVSMDFEGFSWPTLIYGVATLMILNAASNCMNAAYDAHIDRINKPYRPIPKGLLTRDEAIGCAALLAVGTATRDTAMPVGEATDGWQALADQAGALREDLTVSRSTPDSELPAGLIAADAPLLVGLAGGKVLRI